RARGARWQGVGTARERGREGILSRRGRGGAALLPRREALQAAEAVAGIEQQSDDDAGSIKFYAAPAFTYFVSLAFGLLTAIAVLVTVEYGGRPETSLSELVS